LLQTGTLTEHEIALRYYVGNSGTQNYSVFKLAYLNAANQSGKKISIDSAIIRHADTDEKEILMGEKVGELPFTFESRRSSCIIQHSEQLTLICKGAFEEVYSLCTHIHLAGDVTTIRRSKPLGTLQEGSHLLTQRVPV
jgi:Mg2+-importing ATPase